jgi:two-component system chemotaxis sensor kinase CheA
MDMSQYRDLFVSEAREHIRTMNDLVEALSRGDEDGELVASLFRMAHSVKGMAASMGYQVIADLAHRMEDLMDGVRKGRLSFDPGAAALLLEGADLLEAMLDEVAQEGTVTADAGSLMGRLSAHTAGMPVSGTEAQAQDTVHSITTASAPPLPPGRERKDSRQTIRIRTELLDSLINITGELVTTKYRFLDVAQEMNSPRLEEVTADLSRLLHELQIQVSTARMLPFSTLADRFPRAVRDLARSRGKEVVFEVEGTELELDRGMLESLADPLIHLIRNAVDHGVEPSHIRQLAGKPPAGKLRLTAERGRDQFMVVLSDDGRGMDPAALIATAIERGILTPEDGWRMSAEQAFLLTCQPGFSTASEVTDVSGRGVGMDAARASIQALGGQFSIDSIPGKGTRMVIRLPLTIAIITVLLVEVGGVVCAVPVNTVVRTVEVNRNCLEERGGRTQLFFEEANIPVVSLHGLVGRQATSAGPVPLVIAEVGTERIALAVDRFVGQQEIYVKPLGRPLSRLAWLSGGAILGDGRLVFILDMAGVALRAGI